MSQFSQSIVRAKLFPSKIGEKNIEVITQSGSLKLYSGIGVVLQLGLFADNGTPAGELFDVSNLSTVTAVVHPADDLGVNYMLQTLAPGAFANIDAAGWNNRTTQHFLFPYSADDTALEPGSYKLAIFGNTNDPLAAYDFYCEADLEILATGIPAAFTEPASESDLLNSVLQVVDGKIGDKANVIGLPGQRIALTTNEVNASGRRGRIWLQAVLVDDTTVVIDEQKEFV